MKRISDLSIRTTILTGLQLGLLIGLTSCQPQEDSPATFNSDTKMHANVIYGVDGRLDYYQVTDDRLKRLADSTVALVKNSDLVTSGTQTLLKGHNYGLEMNLCSTEKFREQDTAAFCSGSLVGPDLVLTAGHCIEAQSDCDSTSFVFGFAVKSSAVLPKSVASSEVYRCREIIKTHRENSGADFALIKLDRVVPNHSPLPVRRQGDVTLADTLVVIGHPVGLPTKITTGGTVRSIASTSHFTANLDTYGGNSGSAVFNANTGLIEGVLVRGEQDFVPQGNCVVSNVCAEGKCRGEDVTKISMLRDLIPSNELVPVDPGPAPRPEENFAATANVKIPDNASSGVTSSLAVTSAPQGRKVFVSVNIQHTYIGDLVVKVVAPDGKSAVLHQRAGGSAKNLVKTFEVTSQLGQVTQAGTYKLVVQDLARVDVGVVMSWNVVFK